jgi:hypothetical protein
MQTSDSHIKANTIALIALAITILLAGMEYIIRDEHRKTLLEVNTKVAIDATTSIKEVIIAHGDSLAKLSHDIRTTKSSLVKAHALSDSISVHNYNKMDKKLDKIATVLNKRGFHIDFGNYSYTPTGTYTTNK